MGVFKYECPHCLKTTFFNDSLANKQYSCPSCLNDIMPTRSKDDSEFLSSAEVKSEDSSEVDVFKYKCPHCSKVAVFNDSQANKRCGCSSCLYDIVPMRSEEVAKPLHQEASSSDGEMGVFKYKCPHCSKVAVFSDSQANKRCSCPKCLYDIVPTLPGPERSSEISYVPRKRSTYVLLGIILGGWGVHNFYAGFTTRGIMQAVLTIFIAIIAAALREGRVSYKDFEIINNIALVGALTIFVWVLCDIIGQKNDVNKVPMID